MTCHVLYAWFDCCRHRIGRWCSCEGFCGRTLRSKTCWCLAPRARCGTRTTVGFNSSGKPRTMLTVCLPSHEFSWRLHVAVAEIKHVFQMLWCFDFPSPLPVGHRKATCTLSCACKSRITWQENPPLTPRGAPRLTEARWGVAKAKEA